VESNSELYFVKEVINMITAIILIAGFLITVITLIVGLLTGAAAVLIVIFMDVIFFGLGIAFIVKLLCDKDKNKEKK
jgi:hypothetical protein